MIEKEFDQERVIGFFELMDGCTDDFLYFYNITENYAYYSPKTKEVFDMEDNYLSDAKASLEKIIYPDDFKMLLADIDKNINLPDGTHNLEYRWKTRDRGYIWISCKGEFIRNNNSIFLVGRVSEIGRINRFDNITGLYFESVLEDAYNKLADNELHKGFLMLVGIDNFKEINEKYGMQAGDRILVMLADILKTFVEDNRQLFRLSGDECAILITDPSDDLSFIAKNLYKRIRNQIDAEIESKGYEMFFNVSAGAISFDAKKDSFVDVLRYAKFTLHSAKINGKNRFEFFNEDEYKSYIKKLSIQEELRESIVNNYDGFELFFQPIYSARTDKLAGAEALLRWKSSKYGFMSPAEFIPLLEESGMIIPVGRWIVDSAAKYCNKWITNLPEFVVHINLSFIQIIKSDILKDVLDEISLYSTSFNHYVFEVTESIKMDTNNSVQRVFSEFKKNGFHLAIDDFGTGYSNFGYMKDHLFNILKVDRSFITDINLKNDNMLLVKFIIQMAHEMRMHVCIEGVETKEELETVKSLGADYIQGYYYGKPACALEFEKQHIFRIEEN